MPTTDDKGKRRVTPEAREAFRQELLTIARHIFLTEGYGAVTIRRITASAGVTPMAFYWYFDSKDALLTVIWDGILTESALDCAELTRQRPPTEQVRAYFEAFVDYWLKRRDYFRFIFLSDAQSADFITLRRDLFAMGGVKRHFDQYDALLQQHLATQGVGDRECIEAFRTLSMYKAFGFLHCAIGIYNYDEHDTRRFRALVLEDLDRCLAEWTRRVHEHGA